MKTITIKQPYASLICEGIKDIENRTWPTKFRGRVLIHASIKNLLKKIKYGETIQFLSKEQVNSIMNSRKETEIFGYHLPVGAIIGSVEIVDCVINHQSIWAEKSEGVIAGNTFYHKESDKCIWNWVLANPVLFAKPITNIKGKLSFWEYQMTNEEYDELIDYGFAIL